MHRPATSTHIPDAGPAGDALVATERRDDIDAETLRSILAAVGRHQIGVVVGTAVPPVLGCVLLYLAGTAGYAIPTAALMAALVLAIGTLPITLGARRRAFLVECTSVGISERLAKRLYWRVARSELRFERGTRSQDEADRLVVTRVLSG